MVRKKSLLFRLRVVGSYFYYYYNKESLHYSDYVSGYMLLYGKDVSAESITRYLRMYSDPYQNPEGIQIWERDPEKQGHFILLEKLGYEVVKEELKYRGVLRYGESALKIKTALFNLDLDALFVFSMIANGYIISSPAIAYEKYIKKNLLKLAKKGLIFIKGDEILLTEDARKLKEALPILIRFFSKYSE